MVNSNTSPLDTVSTTTFSKRKVFFQFILVLSIIGAAVFTVIAYKYDYLNLDLTVTKYLQDIHIPVLDHYFSFVTYLGNNPQELFLIIFAMIPLLILKRNKDAIFLATSSVGIILLSEILKDLIARPRPSSLLIQNTLANLPAGSFPSGHVLFFCGFFGSILFLTYTRLKRGWFRNALLGLLLILIFSVGISRIYFGAHWTSDVIGSYFIGFIWLYLMSFVYRYLKL